MKKNGMEQKDAFIPGHLGQIAIILMIQIEDTTKNLQKCLAQRTLEYLSMYVCRYAFPEID